MSDIMRSFNKNLQGPHPCGKMQNKKGYNKNYTNVILKCQGDLLTIIIRHIFDYTANNQTKKELLSFISQKKSASTKVNAVNVLSQHTLLTFTCSVSSIETH